MYIWKDVDKILPLNKRTVIIAVAGLYPLYKAVYHPEEKLFLDENEFWIKLSQVTHWCEMPNNPNYTEKSFFEQYLDGDMKAEEIDDFIDKWNEGGSHLELYEFLGMYQKQYFNWVNTNKL